MTGQKTDHALADLLRQVQSLIDMDWSKDWLGYPRSRTLKAIRDFLRHQGFPVKTDDMLGLTLIPYISHEAQEAGFNWREQQGPQGPLAAMFEIDAKLMTGGLAREAMSADQFKAYLELSDRVTDEFREIRARMHNGDG